MAPRFAAVANAACGSSRGPVEAELKESGTARPKWCHLQPGYAGTRPPVVSFDIRKIALFQAKPIKPSVGARENPTVRALRELHRRCSKGGGFELEKTMLSYDVLLELACICARQAREAKNPGVSAELSHLARGYQIRAASMNKGRLPDIGELPVIGDGAPLPSRPSE
jgi:hypothetical protein